MAVVTGCFLDTSVLLAGIIDFGASSVAPKKVLDEVAAGRLSAATAWHCCLELYAVSTRLPPEFRLAPKDAADIIAHEVLERIAVHEVPTGSRLSFLRRAADDRVVGGRLYDAHIAATAHAAGATLVATENRRHFTALLRDGIRVLSASEVLAELGAG